MAQHVPEEKKGGDNDKSSSSTKPAAANEADDRDVSGDVSDDYRLLPISGSVFLGYDKEAKCDGLKFMAQDEEDDRWGTNNHGLVCILFCLYLVLFVSLFVCILFCLYLFLLIE